MKMKENLRENESDNRLSDERSRELVEHVKTGPGTDGSILLMDSLNLRT